MLEIGGIEKVGRERRGQFATVLEDMDKEIDACVA